MNCPPQCFSQSPESRPVTQHFPSQVQRQLNSIHRDGVATWRRQASGLGSHIIPDGNLSPSPQLSLCANNALISLSSSPKFPTPFIGFMFSFHFWLQSKIRVFWVFCFVFFSPFLQAISPSGYQFPKNPSLTRKLPPGSTHEPWGAACFLSEPSQFPWNSHFLEGQPGG